MAKLIYFMPTSLDGYIADEPGPYDSSAPDDEVFAFINDLERPIGIYLYAAVASMLRKCFTPSGVCRAITP